MDDLAKQWRDHVITQYNYAISILLSFSLVALGYGAALLRDKEFMSRLNVDLKEILLVALTSLVFSVAFGLAAILTRLYRTYHTFRKAGNDVRNDGEYNQKLIKLYGRYTHCFLIAEALMFVIGITLIIFIHFSVYWAINVKIPYDPIILNPRHVGIILVLIGTIFLAFSVKVKRQYQGEVTDIVNKALKMNPNLHELTETRIIRSLFWIGLLFIAIGSVLQW